MGVVLFQSLNETKRTKKEISLLNEDETTDLSLKRPREEKEEENDGYRVVDR